MTPNINVEKTSGETFYEVLGIAENARQSDIKSAYYRLSNCHHPGKRDDMCAGANALFRKVSEAYQVLADPLSRRNYDKYVRMEFAIMST